MRIYLSGPMAGLPEHNYPAFNVTANELRSAGHEVVNPAELHPEPGKTWEQCLRTDIRELCSCDAIALMPGWERSKGANLELHIAHRVGMDVIHLPMAFDLVAHLRRQIAFSERTFGPGHRVKGVIDHIEKELEEVRASGGDLSEWIDVIILGLDGAWRSGATAEQIAAAIAAKQAKNESRLWPDWRTAEPDKAIEHVRSADEIIG
jgi:hypothetical protein